MADAFLNRLRNVWAYFLPAWILPFYFLSFKHVARLIGLNFAVVGFFALILATLLATRVKRHFTWAEFYLLWAVFPMGVLLTGFCGLIFIARVRTYL